MKNFRITDGDLDLAHSHRVDMVTGRNKLGQDLTLWLLEPLGTGFTTPGFGSTLNSVVTTNSNINRREGRFIGQQFSAGVEVEIEAEIDRILSLYQQDQVQKIRAARAQGRLYLYSRSEVLDSVEAITTSRDRDAAVVQVDIKTGNNGVLDLLAQIDDEEVQVSAS